MSSRLVLALDETDPARALEIAKQVSPFVNGDIVVAACSTRALASAACFDRVVLFGATVKPII